MIELITSGFYTSIQDKGRYGYRASGVPLSGAMDMHSATIANQLVGNENNEGVIEFTVTGPMLRFHKETTIAITGAVCNPILNGEAVAMNKCIDIPINSTLKLGTALKGMRGYIAIQGGINTEVVLGSRSQYNGITSAVTLKKGDIINTFNTSKPSIESGNNHTIISLDKKKIQVYKGPEFNMLPKEIMRQLEKQQFTIAPQSNRMGYVLKGLHSFDLSEIITVPVQPGTVQLPPSGDLMVLMRDSQTTGGYPRVLQLTKMAINLLSQKRPLEKIKFQIIDFQ